MATNRRRFLTRGGMALGAMAAAHALPDSLLRHLGASVASASSFVYDEVFFDGMSSSNRSNGGSGRVGRIRRVDITCLYRKLAPLPS